MLVLANQITARRFLSGINYLVRSMADDVELMNVACERTLETFKIESLKHLQREALENLVDCQDVFLIQPTGSGRFESCGARTSDNEQSKQREGRDKPTHRAEETKHSVKLMYSLLKESDTSLWRS